MSGIRAGALAALLLGVVARGEADLRLAREEYPVVDGSTSTQPLGLLVAGRVTRTSVEWRRTSFFDPTRFLALTGVPYDDSRKLSLEPTAAEPRGPDLGTALSSIGQLAERVRHFGTQQSYARLATGQADLVLAARGPTPAEREAVRRGGTEIVTLPIAQDAFVFLRHTSNPVTGVTLDQVRDIYAGVLTSWKILGGADRPIVAYQRDATSGSQVEMEQLVMRGRPMREGPDIRVTMAMFGPFNAIRHDPTGIGYSYHYYERFMAVVPEVTTLAIDGILPERATIASGRYPLGTAVLPRPSRGLAARRLGGSPARLAAHAGRPGGDRGERVRAPAAGAMKVELPYGDGAIAATLPAGTRRLSSAPEGALAPLADLDGAVRAALAAPRGLRRIRDLVKPGAQVTIAFALHRMLRPGELRRLLDDRLADEFAGHLSCHDAEDPSQIADLGPTPEHG